MDRKPFYTQRPADKDEDGQPMPEWEIKFLAMFGKCWGEGWKVGYNADPDSKPANPYADPDMCKWWFAGLVDGASAREIIDERKMAA